ncbi:DUF2905 domain-containing protein [Chloroflexota bacterium]
MINDISDAARLLIAAGLSLALLGGILLVAGRFSFLGRLPGDIFIKKGDFTFIFPVVTFILASLALTVILNVILRNFHR